MVAERPINNPRAKDRYHLEDADYAFGWTWAKHQVVNKIGGDWNFAVINTDREPAPYKPDDELGFEDGRVVTRGEGTRHVATGRKAKLNRKHDGTYEVRAYRRDWNEDEA